MCGRFAQFSPVSLIKEDFDIGAVKCDSVQSSYNIAPSQDVLAVAYYGERILSRFFWGIISRIGKETSEPPLLINARIETIAEKPSFRDSYKFRRCLIPADGFYEWEKTGSKKQPWFFKSHSELPFAFAGIWEKRKKIDEPYRPAFAIITREAAGPVSGIHNRMPVILDRKYYGDWLNPDEKNPKRLGEIIRKGALTEINGYPVSKKINSVTNNNPSCIEPADAEVNCT